MRIDSPAKESSKPDASIYRNAMHRLAVSPGRIEIKGGNGKRAKAHVACGRMRGVAKTRNAKKVWRRNYDRCISGARGPDRGEGGAFNPTVPNTGYTL